MTEDEKKANRVQVLREAVVVESRACAPCGVSVLTIDRVERGAQCRLDTKRKIILALGLKVTDREQVFED